MGCSSPPPASPDYVGAADATAQGNFQNLVYQTDANRVNTSTPVENTTWTQSNPTFDSQGYQQALAAWKQGGSQGAAPTQQEFTNGQWTENESLTPQAQAALNSQLQIQQNQSSLANSMEGQVAKTMSQPFNAPSYASYMDSVNPVNQTFNGFSPTGVNGVNQTELNANGVVNGVQGLNQNLNTAGTQVNPFAPQFNQNTANMGANAAFNAQEGMIQPIQQQETSQLDAQLRLQGLTPGTEAYNTAMQNQLNANSQQNDQLANQSVQTGDEEANANYASTLAGYQAGNAAAGQQYSQNANTMTEDNTARTQALENNEGIFNENLTAQQAANEAQNQAYSQALSGYGANQAAEQAENQAQAQAFGEAQSGYNSAYSAAMQQYMEPLNAMNAVLTGNQVNVPSLTNTPSTTAGYVPGADMTSATNALGSWDQGIYNAQQAASGQTTGAVAGLAGTALMAAAMY